MYIESKQLDLKLNEQISLFKQLLLGENSYFLCAGDQLDWTKVFGRIKSRDKEFSGSSILNKQSSTELVKLCGFDSKLSWQLVYKGTRDGFRDKDFHSKCDCKMFINKGWGC